MFTTLVLTLNEERALPGCLASLKGCDDVVVLDSGSTDRTRAMAEAAGARFFSHRFESFAQQRNHAHAGLPLRHPWVLHLDADERLTPELLAECLQWPDDAPYDGAYIAPRMLFNQVWLRRCTDFPAYQARFVRRDGFRWVQSGHGQREAPGMRMTHLRHSYTHEMMLHGEAAWLEKHRRYARQEAAAQLAQSGGTGAKPGLGSLFSGDPLIRRRALKHVSFRLPGRPYLRLFYQYVLRGGFLDGRSAWTYCRLLSRYERFIGEALREAKRPPSG